MLLKSNNKRQHCVFIRETQPFYNIKTRKAFPNFTLKLLLKKVSFSICFEEMHCSQEEALLYFFKTVRDKTIMTRELGEKKLQVLDNPTKKR